MEKKMPKRGLIITILQVLLIVAFLPFLIGQNQCPINQNLNSALQDLIKDKFIPPPGQDYLYITQLSFIDVEAYNQNDIWWGDTEESRLINQAVEDGIWRATKINRKLKYDEPGHIVVDNYTNHNRLTNILTNSTLTLLQKADQIIRKMMSHVDVLVAGYYLNKGKGASSVTLIPLIIVKEDKRTSIIKLTLNKREYLCTDPMNSRVKVLCTGAHEKIAKAVKKLLEQL